MQRDEQDPTIMDLDPDASLESQRPPEKSGDDDPPLKDDPAYEKYFKMLKMVGIVSLHLSTCGHLLLFLIGTISFCVAF